MVCLMDTEKVFVHIQLVGRQLNKRGPEGNILLLRVSPETHGGDQTEQCTAGVRPGEWRWIRCLGPFCWTARSCQNRSQKEEIEAVGFERKKETVSISRWHECVHGNPHPQKSIDHHADFTAPWSSELVVMFFGHRSSPRAGTGPRGDGEQVQSSWVRVTAALEPVPWWLFLNDCLGDDWRRSAAHIRSALD